MGVGWVHRHKAGGLQRLVDPLRKFSKAHARVASHAQASVQVKCCNHGNTCSISL